MAGLRAITVCVDYADILSLSLSWNVHHFDEYWIVTSTTDLDTAKLYEACKVAGLPVFIVKTDRFYRDGATFNKWAGLELGLNLMGKHGWLAVLDADVLWPRIIPHWRLDVGCLYTPLRRMFTDLRLPIPLDSDHWNVWPLHPQQVEWAGYSQVFHASDPALPKYGPWYEGWKHAGGADSFFQRRWLANKKLRPPFEVLHIGESGKNWCGRVTPYLDGKVHPDAADHETKLREFIVNRRVSRQMTGDPYKHERLP